MATTTDVHATRLRRDPDFRRYWWARMASMAGSMVTYVALPVLVYQVTGSNLWTGLVAVAEGLPYLCFGLFAGALADRADRRRIMVSADLGAAAMLASISAAYALGALTAPHVLLAAFAAQSCFAFFDGANNGALPVLAGQGRLAAANSALAAGGTIIEVIVPALAGALLVVLAPAPLIALDALSFVASALLVRAIVRPLRADAVTAPRTLVVEIGEGLRFLFGHRLVRAMTLIGTLVNVSAAAFVSQLVPWMDQVLGVRPSGDLRFGVLWMVIGLGGVAGSLVFPAVVRRLGEARVALAFLPVAALFGTACALAGFWLVAGAFVGLWYLTFMLVALATVTLRQKITPDRLMGRVNTTGRLLAYGVGWPSGALVGGIMSETYGPAAAVWAAVAAISLAAVVAALSPLRTASPRQEAVQQQNRWS